MSVSLFSAFFLSSIQPFLQLKQHDILKRPYRQPDRRSYLHAPRIQNVETKCCANHRQHSDYESRPSQHGSMIRKCSDLMDSMAL